MPETMQELQARTVAETVSYDTTPEQAEALRLLKAEIEAGLIVLEGYTTRRVPEGDPGDGLPFPTYSNGFLTAEGQDLHHASSFEAALELTQAGLRRARHQPQATYVLWREPLTLYTFDDPAGFSIYCRCLFVRA